MKPWVADANNMDADEIIPFENNLLHPSPEIGDFLHHDNKTTTIVVAPKGFGKTLLLKAKCKSLQGNVTHIIPSNGNLVDKPASTPQVIRTKGYEGLRETSEYWHSLWFMAFSLAILKEIGETIPAQAKALNTIMSDEKLRSPCDIFIQLTSLPYNDYYQLHKISGDHFGPALRALNKSVAIFIDNIDEYYEDLLKDASRHVENTFAGRQDKTFWYRAQFGVAQAARSINHINSHIKIYVSIRKEILQKATINSSFGTQLRSKSLIIEYSHRDLESIIEKNIRAERRSNFYDQSKVDSDPLQAFFNAPSRLVNPGTGDEEKVIDFWLRHTLGRPRDVVMIGAALSALKPEMRTENEIRAAVRGEAVKLVREYISEIQPHLDRFDPELLFKDKELKGNVLLKQTVSALGPRYNWEYKLRHNTEHGDIDVFTSLYNVGLLGYVAFDAETRKYRQIFRKPGEAMLDEHRTLPDAELYLIHPMLDAVIQEVNPGYSQLMNLHNIIGPGLPWQDQRNISYILKGDVAGHSSLMRIEGAQRRFESFLQKIVRDHGAGLDYSSVESGDSIKLVSSNPIKLVQAARIINQAMEDEFALKIRFGGDAGFITTTVNTEPPGQDSVLGEAVLRAARLEPHVRPGSIFVTQKFVDQYDLRFKGSRAVDFDRCTPEDLNRTHGLRPDCVDGRFNLSKHEFDSSDYTEIYSVKPGERDGG